MTKVNLNEPRTDVPTWHEWYMNIAAVGSTRSKDPSTQVGAVIVSSLNRVLSIGYNGTPVGIEDDDFPWAKTADNELDTKYPYVIHAERNAVLSYRGSLQDFSNSTVYVTHFPCNECAKELIQVGVKRVIYKNDYQNAVGLAEASIRMFDLVGVEYMTLAQAEANEDAR